MKQPTYKLPLKKRGFTLVELLVVIVIAGIILAIAIPRLRIINKERNLREAARVVGSAFANASQRAVSDGAAGVRIVRNQNFLQAPTQQFAATEVSLLRSVPNYVGDQAWVRNGGVGATKPTNSSNMVQIPKPIEHDDTVTPPRLIVEAGDEISFNNSSIRFRISTVTVSGNNMNLTLEVVANAYPSIPATLMDVPYVIHRRPRVLRSSVTELPNGTIIDLRYSGFEANDSSGTLSTVFEPIPTFGGTPTDPENYVIDVVFADDGSVDRVFYIDESGEVVNRTPIGPLSFFIIETPDSFDETRDAAISDAQALWVSVGTNGTTNVGFNNPQAIGDTEAALGARFENDRDLFNDTIIAARNNSLSTSAAQ